MKSPFFAGAAALALIAIPAAAQDMDGMDDMDGDTMSTTTMTDDVDPYEMSADQSGMYDGWPADRRTTYDGWPGDVQEYYWTLDDSQTEGWWMLNDEQRTRIYGMTPEQRTMAWQQISTQMNAMDNSSNTASTTGMTARTTATTTTGANNSRQPRFVRSEVTQTTPAGYQAAGTGSDLPVCTANQQDGCINSWEKNRTGNRPLEYWPGRPASQIDEPLPATRPDSSDD